MTYLKDNAKEIPILRIPFFDRNVADLQESLELAGGFLTLGPQTTRFESLFKDVTGAKYAVAVSNRTASLEAIFRSMGIEVKSIVVHIGGIISSRMDALGDLCAREGLCIRLRTAPTPMGPPGRAAMLGYWEMPKQTESTCDIVFRPFSAAALKLRCP